MVSAQDNASCQRCPKGATDLDVRKSKVSTMLDLLSHFPSHNRISCLSRSSSHNFFGPFIFPSLPLHVSLPRLLRFPFPSLVLSLTSASRTLMLRSIIRLLHTLLSCLSSATCFHVSLPSQRFPKPGHCRFPYQHSTCLCPSDLLLGFLQLH